MSSGYGDLFMTCLLIDVYVSVCLHAVLIGKWRTTEKPNVKVRVITYQAAYWVCMSLSIRLTGPTTADKL